MPRKTPGSPVSAPPPTALFPIIVHPKKRAFLLAYVACGQVVAACAAAHIDHRLHYYWKRTDPAYLEAYGEAQQILGEHLEEEAFARAYAGSDTLLIFLLKGAMPHKYGERVKVAHTGANDQEFVLKVQYANERPDAAPDRGADSPQMPAPAATPFLIQPGEA